MLDAVTSAATQALPSDDLVGQVLGQAQGTGGVLDIGKLAGLLAEAPDLIGPTLERLPLLDATRLVASLDIVPASPLNIVTDLAPGPVGDVLDPVLEQTTPVADPLYQSHNEKAAVEQFEAQMAGSFWQARGDADLQRVLSPYLKGPQAQGPSRYAVEVESVIDAIKRGQSGGMSRTS